MKQRYRLFWKDASHSIVACILALSGCSSTPPPEVTPIEVSQLEDIRCSNVDNQSEEVRPYKCTLKEEEAFVVAIKDCSLPEPLTLSATTRKLIVGMLETTILEQEPTSLGSHSTLRSLVSGIMDATPIIMSVYTLRRNSCIEDFIVWRETETVATKADETTAVFKSLSDAMFQRASRIGGT